ncbi:MAG: hypothetical protein Tsb009_35590 [Planctomycetaceae bacterium]
MSSQSEIPEPPFTTRTKFWLITSFLLVAFVVLFDQLGDFRTLGSHEVYAAVPAREMSLSGNWVVPRYGGLPRLRKPPLVYWVLATTAGIFGEFNEWVVRVPAALSALALSVLMGFWASRWYGKSAGWFAVFAQLTAVWVLIFSRKAEIDMMLCLFTTTAMFLFANQPNEESARNRFLRWAGIWGLLSLAWLGKFHYGPTMVIAPCGLYLLIQKRFRSILNFFNPLGLILFAAAVFLWPYFLLEQIPEAFTVWKTETVGRAVGEMGHKPFWFYVPHVLWLTLPWTPLALMTVPDSWRRAWKNAEPRERFLWVWFLTQFAIVTLSANKHKHYLNTAFPMATLLASQTAARMIAHVRSGNWTFSRRSAWTVGGIVLIAGIGIGIAGLRKWPELQSPVVGISIVVIVGGLVTNGLVLNRKPVMATVTVGMTFLVCYAGVNRWIMPYRDHRQAVAFFAQETRKSFNPDEWISVYKMGETSVVYYLENPVQRMESQTTLTEKLQTQGRLHVVTFEPLAKEVMAVGNGKIVKRMEDRPGIPRPKHAPLVLIELTTSERNTIQPTTRTASQNSAELSTVR